MGRIGSYDAATPQEIVDADLFILKVGASTKKGTMETLREVFNDLDFATYTAGMTLQLSDAGKMVQMDVSSVHDIVIPPNSSVPFRIGTTIAFDMLNTGMATFVAGSGVTLLGSNVTFNAQYQQGYIYKIALNTWRVCIATAVGGGAVDTTAPLITSIEAVNANRIDVTFDEDISGTQGFVFDNGSPLTIASATIFGGNVIRYTITETMTGADTITYDYDGSGELTPVQDLSGNLLAADSGAVDNNISSGYDADAQAGFDRITAIGATSTTTEKDAVDQLIVDLKAAAIWSKIHVLKPRIGSSVNAMLTNFSDPTVNGTMGAGTGTVHADGLQFAGGTDWENTGFDILTIGSDEIGWTGVIQEAVQNVYAGSPGSASFTLYLSDGATLTAYPHIAGGSDAIVIPSIVGGKHTMQRIGTTSYYYRGTTLIGSGTITDAPMDSVNVGFHAWGGGITINADTATSSLDIIHEALDGTERSALNTAIDAFLTALSR
jgi:hypothetical protein